MFGVVYVAIRWIPYIFSTCLRKLASPQNRRKYKYNKYRYKGEDQKFFYRPILGSYENWQIINCIYGIKQQGATNTDKKIHIK